MTGAGHCGSAVGIDAVTEQEAIGDSWHVRDPQRVAGTAPLHC